MSKVQLYRLGFTLLPRLPRQLVRGIAVVVGLLLWVCAGAMRRRVRKSFAHVPTLAANPARLDRVVRNSFVHLLLNYIDLFTAPGADAHFVANYPIEGEELLHQALQEGKGCIALGMHCDTFEASAWRFTTLVAGVSVLLPVELLQPPALYDLVREQRERSGMHVAPVTDSNTLREMIRTLRAGGIVTLAIDRDVLQTGVAVPFFNAPTCLPVGPIALARLTGAPIIFALPWREGLGRYRGHFSKIYHIAPNVRSPAAVAAALQTLAQEMEGHVLAHPEQWLGAFAHDMWQVEPEADHVATPVPAGTPV